MSRLTLVLIAALASLTISTAHAQTCTEPHYRWSEKIDTSFAHQTPTDVDVSGMLTWTPHTITAKDKCAKRIGREKNVYAVTAYVRRIKLRESDGDWHIEITEEESTPVPASCVIVEIPAPANGSRYGESRDQLAGLVDTTHLGPNGDLNAPVQVTFTGAAFFDGYHQKTTQGVKRASQHGRCNSSVRAVGASSYLRSQSARRPVNARFTPVLLTNLRLTPDLREPPCLPKLDRLRSFPSPNSRKPHSMSPDTRITRHC